MKRDYIKEEKGSISTLVLFTILMFITILIGVYFSIITLQKSQLKSSMRIKDIYSADIEKVDEIYINGTTNEITNETMPNLELEDIIFELSTEEWTNENIIVTTKVNNENLENYTIQTSLNSTEEESFKDTVKQTVTNSNDIVYVKLVDDKGNNTNIISSIDTISNFKIDKNKPTDSKPSVNVSTKSITVTNNQKDNESRDKNNRVCYKNRR